LRLETATSVGNPWLSVQQLRSSEHLRNTRGALTRRIIVAAIRTSDCERRSKNVLAHSVQPLIRFRFADLRLTNRAAAL
ncbi:MAG TPA: hypothetical protein VFO36_04765, partial [Nitrospiraceae bacterium]|nr:hypothetical protein [Nitrospiraceae bacterium]